MRFTVSSTALSSKLQALSKVINSKNSMPILECFLFEINGQQLSMTASDGENVMKSTIALDAADADARFAVPSATVLEAMRELPEQPLQFDVDLNSKNIIIHYQNGVYNFTAQNADEYPLVQPISGDSRTISLSCELLSENLNRTLFATGQDELRPVMNGVYFDLTSEGLAIVASDGHKLVRNINFNIKTDQPAAFILPKKPATLLKNILGKEAGDVTIQFNERNVEITFADTVLNSRLIEGRYPNYNSVIPKNNPNRLTIDRKVFISALRRVLPFASESSQQIRLTLEMGLMKLSSQDIDFSTSAEEKLTCDYTGQNMSIGFKGSSLTEILTNLDCENVDLLLADPSRAGIIVPSQQKEGEDVLMLIMPMLLND